MLSSEEETIKNVAALEVEAKRNFSRGDYLVETPSKKKVKEFDPLGLSKDLEKANL